MKREHYKLLEKEDREDIDYIERKRRQLIFTLVETVSIVSVLIYRVLILFILLGIALKDYIVDYRVYAYNVLILTFDGITIILILFAILYILFIIILIIRKILIYKKLKSKQYDLKFKEYDLNKYKEKISKRNI